MSDLFAAICLGNLGAAFGVYFGGTWWVFLLGAAAWAMAALVASWNGR